MKKNYVMLLYAFLLVTAVKAQSHQLKVGIGYQRTWMLDKQASPLTYQTSEKTVLLGYTANGSKGKFNAQINGALGDFFPTGFSNRQLYNSGYGSDGAPKRDSTSLIGTIYNARIKVGYSKLVSTGNSTIGKNNLYSKNFVGASINNQIFYSDNFVRTGWLNATSVNAELEHMANLGVKHFFSIKASIPLFGRNTRLPYHNSVSSATGDSNLKTVFKQGSRFAWLANFQNIQIEASYDYALSNKVNLGIHYSGQWLHYNYEMPITLFQNNVGITATLK